MSDETRAELAPSVYAERTSDEISIFANDTRIRVAIPRGHTIDDCAIEYSSNDGWKTPKWGNCTKTVEKAIAPLGESRERA